MKDKLRELAEWMRDINGHCADALTEILEQQADWPSDADVRSVLANWFGTAAPYTSRDVEPMRAALQSVRAPAQAAQVSDGDGAFMPVEQLSELMRGLELGPASACLAPSALYCIGRAIASQAKEATQPHSPDAADSGLVTAEMIIAFHEAQDDRRSDTSNIRNGLKAALAAQPQCDPAATPTEPMMPVPEHAILTLDGGFQVPITRSGDGYVCDWLKAPAASPVGVPDGWVLVPREPIEAMLSVQMSPSLVLGDPRNSRVQSWRYAIYKAMLAAAPSATPEGGEVGL